MNMYQKIERLFRFDSVSKHFIKNAYANKAVSLLLNNDWVFTEKIDGMNFRIYWNGHTLTYAGRTDDAKFSEYEKAFIESELVTPEREIMFEQMFGEKTCLVYGELYGNKIGKVGNLYSDKLDFRVFDVEVMGIMLAWENDVASTLGFKTAPIVFIGTVNELLKMMPSLKHSTFSNAPLEGVVGKPIGEFRDRLGKRIIIKITQRDLEKLKEN